MQRPVSTQEIEWREVPSRPGYMVSSLGQVWSPRSGRVIRGIEAGQMKYLCVDFWKEGREYVHRMVCEAFHGPAAQNMQVRHLYGNPRNNRPDHVSYGDKEYNSEETVPNRLVNWYQRVKSDLLKKKRAEFAAHAANLDTKIKQLSGAFGSQIVINVKTGNEQITVTAHEDKSTKEFSVWSQYDRKFLVDIRHGEKIFPAGDIGKHPGPALHEPGNLGKGLRTDVMRPFLGRQIGLGGVKKVFKGHFRDKHPIEIGQFPQIHLGC